MNNLDFLRKRLVEQPEEFGLKTKLRPSEIGIEVSPARFEMRTGRLLYRVFTKGSNEPSLIAQSVPLWSGINMTQNPYEPPHCFAGQLKDVLPQPAGVIENDGRKVFWARFIKGRSLSAILRTPTGREALRKAVKRLSRSPWGACSRLLMEKRLEVLRDYLRMAESVCGLLPELKEMKPVIRENLDRNWEGLHLGFSHGDIWCNDIILTEAERICILDWEWVASYRPVTTDLLDLVLSAIEHYYGFRRGETLTCFLHGSGSFESMLRNELKKIWQELEYNARSVRATILAYLVWAQYRIMQQTLFHMPPNYLDYARALFVSIKNPSYLKSLTK